MTSRRRSPVLRRWADGTPGDALDARLSQLFRAVPTPRGLSAKELAEVSARLRSPVRARPLLFGRYAAVLGVGLIAGTGFAVASFGVERWIAAPPPAPPAGSPVSVVTPRAPSPAAHRASPPLARAPVPEPPALLENFTPKEPLPALPASASAAPAAGPLARESELLARALSKLRGGGDAAGALVALDEYQREFPRGTLALESEVARLDAFLALGRYPDALALLDRLPIDRIGRGLEPRVLRAELRAREAPARALADYDHALAAPLPRALEERALFGRASCRLRANDRAGARADLERYVARHPEGRFRLEAEQQLTSLRPR